MQEKRNNEVPTNLYLDIVFNLWKFLPQKTNRFSLNLWQVTWFASDVKPQQWETAGQSRLDVRVTESKGERQDGKPYRPHIAGGNGFG